MSTGKHIWPEVALMSAAAHRQSALELLSRPVFQSGAKRLHVAPAGID